MAKQRRRQPTSHPLLEQLRAESRALQKRIAPFLPLIERKRRVDALIAEYETDQGGAPAPEPERKTARPARNKLPATGPESPFFGKALPGAAMEHLAVIGSPQSARQIWTALEQAGFPTEAKNPVHSVQWGLRRREQDYGDVVLVGWGKWGLRKWYTDDQLAELNRNLGGMGGRDRESHVEKTKKGIANVKARGFKWGRGPAVKGEHMAIFVEKRRAGESMAAAARATGFAVATMRYQLDKYDVDNWNPGDPWPPPPKGEAKAEPKETESTTPKLRVVQ